jgi:hypothetical protein
MKTITGFGFPKYLLAVAQCAFRAIAVAVLERASEDRGHD